MRWPAALWAWPLAAGLCSPLLFLIHAHPAIRQYIRDNPALSLVTVLGWFLAIPILKMSAELRPRREGGEKGAVVAIVAHLLGLLALMAFLGYVTRDWPHVAIALAVVVLIWIADVLVHLSWLTGGREAEDGEAG